MTQYTTAQIDAAIAQQEAILAKAISELAYEGRNIKYRPVAEIRSSIAYWSGLYATASDAPTTPTPKIRTYLMYGGKNF
jgi:hypothetical protein